MPSRTRKAAPAPPPTILPLFVLNAFAERVGTGNPAAVCPLERWLPDPTLQAIATENQRSETAFLVPRRRKPGWWDLRWFTPAVEVDLCGHATLAAAEVLFRQNPELTEAHFQTQSGSLHVRRGEGMNWMDFPAYPIRKLPVPLALKAWLGRRVLDCRIGRDLLVVLEDPAYVRALEPDFGLFAKLEGFGLIVTAKGDDCDFVSRFFAPKAGVPEDPVTGSAHCMLTPYWAERTGCTEFTAHQVSQRGGWLRCRMEGGRVQLGGTAILYASGHIHL